MVLSRITMSWATPSTARIHHRLLWFDSPSLIAASPGGANSVVTLIAASVDPKWS